MNILRQNITWLSYRVNKHLKNTHGDLFNSFFYNIYLTFYNSLTSRKNWLIIFILVVTFFSISSFINIDFFNFVKFDSSIAKSIIDQRTTNLAAIISMSLVVVGFLITNLAMKSSTTIKLLFKNSYIYFTLYVTFSTIGCFILLSNLRDTLSPFVFSRAVLAGTYLCVLILFLIGILFRNIIHFTDEKKISDMLKKELISEAKQKLIKNLFEKYSCDLYNKILSKDCVKYNSIENITLNNLLYPNNASKNNFEEEEIKVLKDVNIFLIKTYVFFKKMNKKNNLQYKSLKINEKFNYNEDIVWSDKKDNNQFEKWYLKRCLKTKKTDNTIDVNIYRNEFDQKIIQLAEESKYRNLEYPLEAYLELYKLQMKNKNV